MRLNPQFSVILLAAALAGAGQAAAQDAASAKAFLAEAYSHYGKNGKGIDLGGPGIKRYFHASLVSLIEADNKANGPENVGALDYDPVCGCQDWGGIFDLKIDVQLQSPQLAVANVSFSLDKSRKSTDLRKLKITLVPQNGAWRIYDIIDMSSSDGPFDVRKALIADIESLKHQGSTDKSPPK